MNFKLNDIIAACGASVTGTHRDDDIVANIIIDSRTPAEPRGTLFCAISTKASDGYRYIGEMYNRGFRLFLVQTLEPSAAGLYGDATFLIVDSVADALRKIAGWHRSQLSDTKFVGITGSVGKTIVKELLYQSSLAGGCSVGRSPRSWNSMIGVPLSVCELSAADDVALIEVGIDAAGEMARHAELVCPEIGVLTPITSEHDAGFASRAEKIAEKVSLFARSKCVIYPEGDDEVVDVLTRICKDSKLIPVDYSAGWLAVVKSVLGVLGYDATAAEKMMRGIELPSNRIDVHEGVNDCVMLYDGFTADARSLEVSLDFMKRRATPTRTNTVVLTDLLHATEASVAEIDDIYESVARHLSLAGVSRVIAIGCELERHGEVFGAFKFEAVADFDEFFKKYDINDFSSETILIFGRPKTSLSAVRAALETPRHDTTLEIDLAALIHNFNYYRSLLKPTTGIIAMVKASAYGVGAVEVAKTLQAQGASYLAVAVVDEGVELRRGGITMPIVVLNPVTGNYKALFDYNLEPSIFSMRELDVLLDAAKRFGIDNFKAHIKLDTGMHRVGFEPEEIDELCRRLVGEKRVTVATIFSHLATADCLDMDEYTEAQLKVYHDESEKIVAALPYKIKRHILNTAGIMRFAEHQYDLVRPGIGLYGISPLPGDSALMPVATLKSTVITIRHWPAGTAIGYSRKGLLNRDSIVATVPIGYADGIDRHFGCGNASFLVNGVMCPTVGNICMDQCMVDITDAPNTAIGDEVEIFGINAPVQRLSDTLGTIPYEILTSVAPRVKRVYYRD